MLSSGRKNRIIERVRSVQGRVYYRRIKLWCNMSFLELHQLLERNLCSLNFIIISSKYFIF